MEKYHLKGRPPTADRVREVLDYNPATGELVWRVDRLPYLAGSTAGCSDHRGRRIISIDGRRYYANRLAWLHVTGKWPEGAIWFRNGDRTDMRWENLEERF